MLQKLFGQTWKRGRPNICFQEGNRDAALRHSTEEWGWSKSPSPGVSPLEGHPPNGAGDGAGTAVMDENTLGLLQSPALSIQSVALKRYRLSPLKLFIVAFGCVREGGSALPGSRAEFPGQGWGCPTPSQAPAAIPAPLWEGTGNTKPLFPAEKANSSAHLAMEEV